MDILRIGRYTLDIAALKKLSKKDLKAILASKPEAVVEAIEKALDIPKKKKDKEGGN
jgi:hypothetical protein